MFVDLQVLHCTIQYIMQINKQNMLRFKKYFSLVEYNGCLFN